MAFPLTHDDPVQLGRYRLVARLGGGGMGTVYLGRTPTGRTLAIKTMHAGFAERADFRARFRLEVDAARVIGGRHGAEVVDADPFSEVPWLATEYVLGPPLDDAVMLAGPLPEPAVRALGAALCAALAQLHASQVVHRDLKPSNILLTATGPKVIDFGIARAIGDPRLTQTGATAGTPAFMSPEQATGREHTSAGDVFALAGLLVYAATGHGPFGAGQPADLLYRVRFAEPDLTGVPGTLLPPLTRCLHKDPAHRPTTTELATHLAAPTGDFTDHLPDTLLTDIGQRATRVWHITPAREAAPEEPPAEPAAAPARRLTRRRLLTAGGAAVLGAAAVGAGAWAWRSGRDEPRSRPANVPSRAVWWAQIGGIEAARPPLAVGDLVVVQSAQGLVALDARTGARLWTRAYQDGGGSGLSWQLAAEGDRLYALIPETAPGLSLHAVDLRDGEPRRVVGPLPGFDSAEQADESALLLVADRVAYLTARARRAGGTAHWRLVAADLRTGKPRWHRPIEFGRYYTAAVSVGRRLVLARPGAFWQEGLDALDPRSRKMLWTTDTMGAELSSLTRGQLVADGRHVYLGGWQVTAVRLSDGGTAWEFVDERDRHPSDLSDLRTVYGRPAVRNGTLYASVGTRDIVALDARRGRTRWRTSLPGGAAADHALAPVVGGKYLYASVDDRTGIAAVDLRTHRVAWTLPVPSVFDGPLLPHARARRLIWTSGGLVCAVPFE
ncbi:hypothetical protein ACZ90_50225 [Streptomyces albus subsp. albus]|nr:hypothetical protein ACZ90_50225 [Streptomyces albus subsp. albus]